MFRGGVDLVAIDVTIVDKDGRPVKGLTANDFVVTLQGQRRAVRVVDFLEFGGTTGSAAAASATQTTNQSPESKRASRGGRVVVLLVDDLSAKPGQAKGLMVAAERMLATLDPADLVGVTTTSGLGIVVNPTRNRAALAAALKSKSLVGRQFDHAAPVYVSVSEAMEIFRDFPRDTLGLVVRRECAIVELGEACPTFVRAAANRVAQESAQLRAMQLEAYAALMNALRAAPKPRVVIALSTGLAVDAETAKLDFEPVSRLPPCSGSLTSRDG